MSEILKSKKIAIILFNLGGPDSLESVKPFLFNLFYDKNIIRLPNPVRWCLAKLISTLRDKKAQGIYSLIGGKSTIIEETENQRVALKNLLQQQIGNVDFEIFTIMRHWHPFSDDVIKKIMDYGASEAILLPLYPQFSTTTTRSSLEDIKKKINDRIPTKTVGCYYSDKNFIESHTFLLKETIKKLHNKNNFRILFSAHGLPEKIIKSGDPYQWQIEQTVTLILNELGSNNLDYKITYQSRVGPVKWLEPNTEHEVELAGKEKKNLVIVPISFVSEHVETLVELDIEYKNIAKKYGIEYLRVPTLGVNEIFIKGLANIVQKFVYEKEIIDQVCDNNFTRTCPTSFSKCICHN